MSTAPPSVVVDLGNVQGLICHFFARPLWRHLLFRFRSADGGKQWLKAVMPHIATAYIGASPTREHLLNLGLTSQGLSVLGVAPKVLDQFPLEFRDEPDASVMGDFGESAPARWWNNRFRTSDIHA